MSVSTDPAWFSFDHDLLEVVVANLISNAIKFSDKGIIRVSLGINAEGEQTVASIAVRDNGPGVPPEDHSRIFERLYRSEEASLSVDGSGIGLAVVKELVEAVGGRVELESMMGIGSTFRGLCATGRSIAGIDRWRTKAQNGNH